jgi:hypothetical protein
VAGGSIDVGAVVDEELNDLGMSVFGGEEEGGVAVFVGGIDVRLVIDEELGDIETPFFAGGDEGGVFLPVFGVDVSTLGEGLFDGV